ncbi:MAG: hypothetical protein AB8B51_18790 [Sedimentitalea sp.]
MTSQVPGSDDSLSLKGAVFVERSTYRRRRLMDAARLLPVLGALMFAVPLLWGGAGDAAKDGAKDGAGITTSDAMLYIFCAWALLIAMAFLFGLSARSWSSQASQDRGQGTD